RAANRGSFLRIVGLARGSVRGQSMTPTSRLAAAAVLLACVVAAASVPLVSPPVAAAATCGASTVTVTPMQSPDGTKRPMYVDISHGATKGSGYVGYELSGTAGVLGSDVWVKLSGFAGGAVGLATNQSA